MEEVYPLEYEVSEAFLAFYDSSHESTAPLLIILSILLVHVCMYSTYKTRCTLLAFYIGSSQLSKYLDVW